MQEEPTAPNEERRQDINAPGQTEPAPHQSAGTGQDLIGMISDPLYRAKGWLTFLGILLIVYGVLTAITIWGLLVAWLPIWMGVLLFQTGKHVELAKTAGNADDLAKSMQKLKTYFTIQGILALIGLIGIGISLIAMLGTGAGLMQMMQG